LSSLSCLPSVTCHRRCFDPLLYSFFVSCMHPALLIWSEFIHIPSVPSMLNSLVSLFYTATQSLVSHSNLLAKSTSTSPSLLFCLVCCGCRRCTSPPLFLVCLSFVFPSWIGNKGLINGSLCWRRWETLMNLQMWHLSTYRLAFCNCFSC
jgi:hypothetical protein